MNSGGQDLSRLKMRTNYLSMSADAIEKKMRKYMKRSAATSERVLDRVAQSDVRRRSTVMSQNSPGRSRLELDIDALRQSCNNLVRISSHQAIQLPKISTKVILPDWPYLASSLQTYWKAAGCINIFPKRRSSVYNCLYNIDIVFSRAPEEGVDVYVMVFAVLDIVMYALESFDDSAMERLALKVLREIPPLYYLGLLDYGKIQSHQVLFTAAMEAFKQICEDGTASEGQSPQFFKTVLSLYADHVRDKKYELIMKDIAEQAKQKGVVFDERLENTIQGLEETQKPPKQESMQPTEKEVVEEELKAESHLEEVEQEESTSNTTESIEEKIESTSNKEEEKEEEVIEQEQDVVNESTQTESFANEDAIIEALKDTTEEGNNKLRHMLRHYEIELGDNEVPSIVVLDSIINNSLPLEDQLDADKLIDVIQATDIEAFKDTDNAEKLLNVYSGLMHNDANVFDKVLAHVLNLYENYIVSLSQIIDILVEMPVLYDKDGALNTLNKLASAITKRELTEPKVLGRLLQCGDDLEDVEELFSLIADNMLQTEIEKQGNVAILIPHLFLALEEDSKNSKCVESSLLEHVETAMSVWEQTECEKCTKALRALKSSLAFYMSHPEMFSKYHIQLKLMFWLIADMIHEKPECENQRIIRALTPLLVKEADKTKYSQLQEYFAENSSIFDFGKRMVNYIETLSSEHNVISKESVPHCVLCLVKYFKQDVFYTRKGCTSLISFINTLANDSTNELAFNVSIFRRLLDIASELEKSPTEDTSEESSSELSLSPHNFIACSQMSEFDLVSQEVISVLNKVYELMRHTILYDTIESLDEADLDEDGMNHVLLLQYRCCNILLHYIDEFRALYETSDGHGFNNTVNVAKMEFVTVLTPLLKVCTRLMNMTKLIKNVQYNDKHTSVIKRKLLSKVNASAILITLFLENIIWNRNDSKAKDTCLRFTKAAMGIKNKRIITGIDLAKCPVDVKNLISPTSAQINSAILSSTNPTMNVSTFADDLTDFIGSAINIEQEEEQTSTSLDDISMSNDDVQMFVSDNMGFESDVENVNNSPHVEVPEISIHDDMSVHECTDKLGTLLALQFNNMDKTQSNKAINTMIQLLYNILDGLTSDELMDDMDLEEIFKIMTDVIAHNNQLKVHALMRQCNMVCLTIQFSIMTKVDLAYSTLLDALDVFVCFYNKTQTLSPPQTEAQIRRNTFLHLFLFFNVIALEKQYEHVPQQQDVLAKLHQVFQIICDTIPLNAELQIHDVSFNLVDRCLKCMRRIYDQCVSPMENNEEMRADFILVMTRLISALSEEPEKHKEKFVRKELLALVESKVDVSGRFVAFLCKTYWPELRSFVQAFARFNYDKEIKHINKIISAKFEKDQLPGVMGQLSDSFRTSYENVTLFISKEQVEDIVQKVMDEQLFLSKPVLYLLIYFIGFWCQKHSILELFNTNRNKISSRDVSLSSFCRDSSTETSAILDSIFFYLLVKYNISPRTTHTIINELNSILSTVLATPEFMALLKQEQEYDQEKVTAIVKSVYVMNIILAYIIVSNMLPPDQESFVTQLCCFTDIILHFIGYTIQAINKSTEPLSKAIKKLIVFGAQYLSNINISFATIQEQARFDRLEETKQNIIGLSSNLLALMISRGNEFKKDTFYGCIKNILRLCSLNSGVTAKLDLLAIILNIKPMTKECLFPKYVMFSEVLALLSSYNSPDDRTVISEFIQQRHVTDQFIQLSEAVLESVANHDKLLKIVSFLLSFEQTDVNQAIKTKHLLSILFVNVKEDYKRCEILLLLWSLANKNDGEASIALTTSTVTRTASRRERIYANNFLAELVLFLIHSDEDRIVLQDGFSDRKVLLMLCKFIQETPVTPLQHEEGVWFNRICLFTSEAAKKAKSTSLKRCAAIVAQLIRQTRWTEDVGEQLDRLLSIAHFIWTKTSHDEQGVSTKEIIVNGIAHLKHYPLVTHLIGSDLLTATLTDNEDVLESIQTDLSAILGVLIREKDVPELLESCRSFITTVVRFYKDKPLLMGNNFLFVLLNYVRSTDEADKDVIEVVISQVKLFASPEFIAVRKQELALLLKVVEGLSKTHPNIIEALKEPLVEISKTGKSAAQSVALSLLQP